MDNRESALMLANYLDSKKAGDIVIIDISEKSGFADFFVIATLGNLRQMAAVSDEIEDKMAENAWFAKNIEGRGESGWILMDFGDIIVNLFTAEQRDHYNIEKIWSDCIKLDFEPSEL